MYLAFCITTTFIFLLIECNIQSQKTTMENLLKEMTKREQFAKLQEPEYTCKQFSSYNKTFEKPGHYTCFTNLDNNNFFVWKTIITDENLSYLMQKDWMP